ncbi:MAG TPA: SMC-Scp complex subunit ScpB [Steroidobacteraceae bacterium]|nr:SMC-Scp complex subunit ScpB [Steroidobacteraceae bacterium]
MSEQMQKEAVADAVADARAEPDAQLQEQIRNIVEAALLAAGRPLSLADLAQLFEEGERPDAPALRAALSQLEQLYATRALEVKQTAAGYRLQVRSRYSAVIGRLWPERPQRYSRALLETLALIAYRQPITRAEIEAVRGVVVNPNIIKTLLERSWIRVVGHRELPGRPELLGTTREFLDYFGLRGLDELPPLSELRSLGELDPQFSELPQLPVAHAMPADESDAPPQAPEPAGEDVESGGPSAPQAEERSKLERAADLDEGSAMVAASRGTEA